MMEILRNNDKGILVRDDRCNQVGLNYDTNSGDIIGVLLLGLPYMSSEIGYQFESISHIKELSDNYHDVEIERLIAKKKAMSDLLDGIEEIRNN